MAKESDPRAELERLTGGLAVRLAPGFVLRGAERWFVARALSALRAKAAELGFEECAHDAADPAFRLAGLQDDLCGAAMFASQRLVIVSGGDELVRKHGAADSALLRAARAFMEQDRGTLVLVAEGLRADSAWIKAAVGAGGATFSFRALWDTPPPWNPDPLKTELATWTLGRARELGVALTRDALLYLTKLRGNDLAALEDELEALAAGATLSVGSRAGDAAGSATGLADQLAEGDAARALVEIETLWRSGFDKGKGAGRETSSAAILAVLFAALRRNVRQGAVGSSAVESGADVSSAAVEAGVPAWPKAREGFARMLSARGPREWQRMRRDLVELERRSRQGVDLDASDLAAFALRWRRRAPQGGAPRANARAPGRPAPGRGGAR